MTEELLNNTPVSYELPSGNNAEPMPELAAPPVPQSLPRMHTPQPGLSIVKIISFLVLLLTGIFLSLCIRFVANSLH